MGGVGEGEIPHGSPDVREGDAAAGTRRLIGRRDLFHGVKRSGLLAGVKREFAGIFNGGCAHAQEAVQIRSHAGRNPARPASSPPARRVAPEGIDRGLGGCREAGRRQPLRRARAAAAGVDRQVCRERLAPLLSRSHAALPDTDAVDPPAGGIERERHDLDPLAAVDARVGHQAAPQRRLEHRPREVEDVEAARLDGRPTAPAQDAVVASLVDLGAAGSGHRARRVPGRGGERRAIRMERFMKESAAGCAPLAVCGLYPIGSR
jgi:hypothetical protein